MSRYKDPIASKRSRIPKPTSSPSTPVVIDLEEDEPMKSDNRILRSNEEENSNWALHIGTGTSTRQSKRTTKDSQQRAGPSGIKMFGGLSPSSPTNPFSSKMTKNMSPLFGTRNVSPSSSPPAFSNLHLGGTKSNTRGMNALQRLHAAAKSDHQTKETLRKTKVANFQGTSWVERNYPTSIDELFVNKKKVEEVSSWLKASLDTNRHHQNKICVLSGNCGSGKTATLFLVAKELSFEIKEWINPMSLTDYQSDRLAKFELDEVQGKSQFDTFTNYLIRASQYNSLPIKGRPRCQNRVVVVEDFPNMFYRDTSSFHKILRSFASMGGCPVVFIIPDSSSSDSNVNKLFPKNLIQDLNIGFISFNPIATTFMVKFLSNLCSKEGVVVDKSVVESVALASGGDIRCAINTLQFKLMKMPEPIQSKFKVPPIKQPRAKKAKGISNNEKSDLVQKDETLFLFRALGKVLYAKRDDTLNVELRSNVPEKAEECLRSNPLQENPEELVSKIEVAADTFLSFIQQNYVPFFGSMDDIVEASSFLADSEYLLSRWPFDDSGTVVRNYKERESREEIALLTASRGVMYANVKRTANTWRPLKKPMFGDVKYRVDKSIESVRHLFAKEGAVQTSFYSEVLPLYAKLTHYHARHWASDQIGFIKEIGTMKKWHRQRLTQDTLNERDAFDEPCSDTETDNQQDEQTDAGPSKNQHQEISSEKNVKLETQSLYAQDSEEEYTIEEYDSD